MGKYGIICLPNHLAIYSYSLQMAQRRSKKGEIFHEDGSDSSSSDDPKRPARPEQLFGRDYISLKSKHSKVRLENE